MQPKNKSPKQRFFKYVLILLAVIGSYYSFSNSSLAPSQAEPINSDIHRYQVKGIIISLPVEQSTQPEMTIRHEDIADYVDESGARIGMNSMTMPFNLAKGLSWQGLKVGDQVEFTLESWWKPKPGDQIVKIDKIQNQS